MGNHEPQEGSRTAEISRRTKCTFERCTLWPLEYLILKQSSTGICLRSCRNYCARPCWLSRDKPPGFPDCPDLGLQIRRPATEHLGFQPARNWQQIYSFRHPPKYRQKKPKNKKTGSKIGFWGHFSFFFCSIFRGSASGGQYLYLSYSNPISVRRAETFSVAGQRDRKSRHR